MFGLICSWTFGLESFGFTIYCIYVTKLMASKVYPKLDFDKEIITLALDIVVTFLNECTGSINSVSLRWSLRAEERLAFNSNIRLLSSSEFSRPNKVKKIPILGTCSS